MCPHTRFVRLARLAPTRSRLRRHFANAPLSGQVCSGLFLFLANRVGTASSFSWALYLSPNWMLSSVRSVKHFFSKCFEHSRSWCFASHNLLVAASHRPTATCHCRFGASFFKGNPSNENSDSFVSFSQQPTAAHSLGICCYWAMRVSCLVVTSRGHVTETRDF